MDVYEPMYCFHSLILQLREENIVLGNKTQVTDDQYNTLVARHERKEEENTKYIKMLSSDVEKCESEK